MAGLLKQFIGDPRICDAITFGELAYVRQPANWKQVMPCLKHDQVQPRRRCQGFHAWGSGCPGDDLDQAAMNGSGQFAFCADPIMNGAMAGLGDHQDLIPALVDGLSGRLEDGGGSGNCDGRSSIEGDCFSVYRRLG